MMAVFNSTRLNLILCLLSGHWIPGECILLSRITDHRMATETTPLATIRVNGVLSCGRVCSNDENCLGFSVQKQSSQSDVRMCSVYSETTVDANVSLYHDTGYDHYGRYSFQTWIIQESRACLDASLYK